MTLLTSGGEVGSWDVVLLEDLTEDNLISNLSQRYKWDQVYVIIPSLLFSLSSCTVLITGPHSLADVRGHLLNLPEPTQEIVTQQQRCH